MSGAYPECLPSVFEVSNLQYDRQWKVNRKCSLENCFNVDKSLIFNFD